MYNNKLLRKTAPRESATGFNPQTQASRILAEKGVLSGISKQGSLYLKALFLFFSIYYNEKGQWQASENRNNSESKCWLVKGSEATQDTICR